MEEAPRLTPGAVVAIWELPDGPAMYKPVLQVTDLRLVTAKNSVADSGQQQKPERYRMLLSDGVHSQQSTLAAALNHLVTDGALRAGSIVQLQDITCNNIEGRRCTCVLLSPLATDWILLLICFQIGRASCRERVCQYV